MVRQGGKRLHPSIPPICPSLSSISQAQGDKPKSTLWIKEGTQRRVSRDTHSSPLLQASSLSHRLHPHVGDPLKVNLLLWSLCSAVPGDTNRHAILFSQRHPSKPSPSALIVWAHYGLFWRKLYSHHTSSYLSPHTHTHIHAQAHAHTHIHRCSVRADRQMHQHTQSEGD